MSDGRSADADVADGPAVGEMGVVVDRELPSAVRRTSSSTMSAPIARAPLNAATVFSGNAVRGAPVGDHGRHRVTIGAPCHMTIACRVPEEALAGS